MRLAIIGSRSITNRDKVWLGIEAYLFQRGYHGQIAKDIPLVSGGATGVDTFAEEYADKEGLDFFKYEPYFKIGPRGYDVNDYFVRNEQIVKNCDNMLVFWDGKSTGTKGTIQIAERWGKIVEVIDVTSS